jgi:hypothetical protein
MNESLSFSGISSVTATGNEGLKMMTEKTGACGPRKICSSIHLKD